MARRVFARAALASPSPSERRVAGAVTDGQSNAEIALLVRDADCSGTPASVRDPACSVRLRPTVAQARQGERAHAAWGPIAGLLGSAVLLTLAAPLSWLLFGLVVGVDVLIKGLITDGGLLSFSTALIADGDSHLGRDQRRVYRHRPRRRRDPTATLRGPT